MKRWIGFVVLLSLWIGFSIGGIFVSRYNHLQPSPSPALERISLNTGESKIEIHYAKGRELNLFRAAEGTDSMLPAMNHLSMMVGVKPLTEAEVRPGSIIAYSAGESVIHHRVVRTGTDSQGWYAKAKGDNKLFADSGKIRFEDILLVTVAIVNIGGVR